ncbi:MAG: glycosyltransferase family 39 protein [Planctomycetota bacterium]|nr:glycosyltransferase family 39 protein [Planctomycetota bacterium]
MHAQADPRPDIDPRSARWALLAIVAVALAVRVVYVLQSRASPLFDAPQMDALYHVEWARALVRGEDYQPGPFFRAPAYPWFLAGMTWLFGDNLLAPRLVQAVIGAGSCALVHALGARLFDRRTGLVSAAIASVYAMLVYFEGELLLPVLEIPTCLAAVLFAVRFGERPGPRRAAFAGLALGIAAIVRPNVLLWGVVVGLWIVARGGAPLAQRLRQSALYGLATLVPILPITAYNAIVGRDLVLISTQGGVNFWIGNNPTSDGSTAIAPGTRPDWWGGFHDTVAQAEAAEGRALKPSEVSGYYSARAWAWIASEPVAAVRHLAWKLWLYWTDHELGNNQDEVYFAREFGPILRWSPVGFGLVAPLGILGLVFAARRWRSVGPAWLFVPAWCASVVAFFVCARFRIPMMPVLGVFAAHALVVGWATVRARRWRGLGAGLVALAVLVALVQTVPRQVDRTPAKGLWQLGVIRFQRGDYAEAERLFVESIDANPRFALAHQDLGLTFLRRGRPAEALASCEDALRLAPGTVGALQGRVEALWALGRAADAAVAAREFARAAPLLWTAHYTLGRALLVLGPGGYAEGRAALQRAVERAAGPDEAFNAHLVAAELERAAGRPREAIAHYDAALAARGEPDAEGWFWKCQTARLETITADGRREEARREARELARRFAADPRAAASLRTFLDP